MLDFILHSFWAQCGIVGVVVAASAAVAWFFPPLRRIALEIIAVMLAATALVAKGKRDEDARWNKAIDRDVKKGQQARSDADRGVESGSVRGTEWDRDARGM